MVALKHHKLLLRLGDLSWIWLKHMGVDCFHHNRNLGPRIQGDWELDGEESTTIGIMKQ